MHIAITGEGKLVVEAKENNNTSNTNSNSNSSVRYYAGICGVRPISYGTAIATTTIACNKTISISNRYRSDIHWYKIRYIGGAKQTIRETLVVGYSGK